MSQPDTSPSLPAASASQGPSATTLPSANPVSGPPGVPIIDDEEGVRRVLGAGLWHYGFAVWLAADAWEAVELYRSHRTAIGVVLLDVQMPGRDGPRALADLRGVDPDVRACFMTGDSGPYTERNLLDLGAFAVFRKPFVLSELAVQLATLTTPIDAGDSPQDARRRDDGAQGTPVAP
jgi:CheY-like chemotaxis protein